MSGLGLSALITKIRPAPALSFLLIGLVQAITVTTLQSIIFIRWQEFLKPNIREVPRGLTVPTNLSIFVFGFVFQLLFMYDAIRLRSTAQVTLACVLNIGFLPFAIFQRRQVREGIESLRGSTDINGEPLVNLDMDIWPVVGKLLLAIPFIVGSCTLFLVISAWYLKQYFSWQLYRNVGADAKLRKMRILHQIFVMLAKMVLYAIICFHIIYGVPVLGAKGTEFTINMVLLGVAIVIVCMSVVWSKSENRAGMIVSIIVYLAGLTYFIYMVIIMHTDKKNRWFYAASLESLTAFGCMAILFILATTIFAIMCTKNFWRGLKEHLGKHEERWDQTLHTKDFEHDTNGNFGYESFRSIRDLDS
ncbi:hypothetical protein DL765_009953 [Monosporascus sp. GIB2]|nr:hypothetical protein DL765_009953 [Monosporascus sp. GIB2]